MAHDRLGEHVARTGNRVVRPRDLGYRDATVMVERALDRGTLTRLAHGYYVIPPDTHRGVRPWRPPVEAVALGLAVADYGRDEAALMGVSAARLRGLLPRAIATAIVAIPKSHRPRLTTQLGVIHFVSRDVHRLDLERAVTGVVSGWATTPEQTVLDIADRPTLGDVSPATASETLTRLSVECDWDLVRELAGRQRRPAALARASWIAAAVRKVDPVRPRRPVPAAGLRPRDSVDPAQFGVAP